MKKRKHRKIAGKIIMYWVGEAWHELDNDYYKNLAPGERKAIICYIHRYGVAIGHLLGIRYKPN